MLLGATIISAPQHSLLGGWTGILSARAGGAEDQTALTEKVAELRLAGKSAEALRAARQALDRPYKTKAATASRRRKPWRRSPSSTSKPATTPRRSRCSAGRWRSCRQAARARTRSPPSRSSWRKCARRRGGRPRCAPRGGRRGAASRGGRSNRSRKCRLSAPSRRRRPPRRVLPEWDVMPIYYGTDRGEEPNEKRAAYGSDRGHRLDLGRALVTIPKSHQVPQVERPYACAHPLFRHCDL